MIQRLTRIFLLLALSFGSGALFAAELSGLRLSSGPTATRLVIDLDRPVSHEVFQLSDPDRVVIDLPATAAIPGLIIPEGKGRVRAVRAGGRDGGDFRIVIDLAQQSVPTSFPLGPEGQFGHRLVIDLGQAGADTTAAVGAAGAATNGAAVASRETVAQAAAVSAPTRVLVDEYTGRDLVIAIDAGHGGRDPGAEHHNTREKDVVLQIAKRLAALFDDMPGFRPVLIRQDDRFIELDDRVRKARDADADFFISIHADALASASTSGASVYSIETGRAVRETSKLLADRNNVAAIVGGEERLATLDDAVTRVLVDLSRDAAINKSRIAGESIIDNLSRVTTMRKPRVEQMSLAVLTSQDIPSLLVETGYISNRSEAAKLRDGNFQQALAQALMSGIVDFFVAQKFAPSDTYVARNPPPVQRPPIRHVIARGETLSEIAARYRTSVTEIRRTNRINGDVIRIGQVLTIPTQS